MQWYRTREGAKRLELEAKQIETENDSCKLTLYQDDETDDLLWQGSVCVKGHSHEVRLVYSENHPYEKMTVYVLKPGLRKHSVHIHDDGSICYMKDDEWSPEWSAFTVFLTLLRFLDDYYSGRMV
jgi:ubiquitin-protein ligase